MNSAITERMTWEDICRAHPDEYVVLDSPEVEAITLRVRSGVLLGHDADRDALLERTRRRQPSSSRAILYTGRVKGTFSLSLPIKRLP